MLRKQVTLQLVTYTLRRERKFYKSTGVDHLLDKNSLISALSFLHVHFPFLCKAAVTKGAGDQFFREKPCREVSSKGLHALARLPGGCSAVEMSSQQKAIHSFSTLR